jgi:hypothetical protein
MAPAPPRKTRERRIAGTLELARSGGERMEIPDWEIYDQAGGMVRRPAGLYAGQRSCCIRGPAGPSLVPVIARGWPPNNPGFAQLTRPPGAEHWRAYDDGETCRCTNGDGEPCATGTSYRFIDAHDHEALSLLLEPIATESAITDPEPNAPSHEITSTSPLGTPTAGRQPSYVLRLTVIALPRIDEDPTVVTFRLPRARWLTLLSPPLGCCCRRSRTKPSRHERAHRCVGRKTFG